MKYTAVNRAGSATVTSPVDELIRHVGRLLRHPGFRRDRVVSPMLRRHLPFDAGYAWNGEDALRTKLAGSGLDAERLNHLIVNARAELERLRGPRDA